MREFHDLIERFERMLVELQFVGCTPAEAKTLSAAIKPMTATYAAGAMAMYELILGAMRNGQRLSWLLELGQDMARYCAENPPTAKRTVVQ